MAKKSKKSKKKPPQSFMKKAWRLVKALFFLLLVFLIVTGVQVLSVRFINPKSTMVILANRIRTGQGPLTVQWTDPEKISINLVRAVLAAEDQRFFEHHGFDWVEINHALAEAKKGKKLRGASTITQQTAKNLFLWEGRSWIRKGLEAYYALLMELLLPKERILEIYLNVAEFGPGCYGADAAARFWYKDTADKLNRDRAARLAVVLPAPKKRSPLKLTRAQNRKRNRLLRQMGAIDLGEWTDSGS